MAVSETLITAPPNPTCEMQGLKRELLRLLEEDREFRLAVAGLIGYRDVLDRLEEHDRKFNELLGELREHRKLLEEHSRRLEEHSRHFVSIERRLEEHDRKFSELLEELREHRKLLEEHGKRLEEHDRHLVAIERRLEEHDRKFSELLEEIARLRREFNRLSMRVEVTIGSVGRRWGTDLERLVLEIFRETLEREGIKPGRVEKFRVRDADGRLTGVRGRVVDVDVLVRDDRVYVLEVKSRAEIEHVEALPEKARVVEKVLGRMVDRIYMVAVNVDREAYERARELGIRVVCGNVID